MTITLKIHLPTQNDIDGDMEDTLKLLARQTADYQHGNLTVDRVNQTTTIDIWPEDCIDLGHTHSCMHHIFNYFLTKII